MLDGFPDRPLVIIPTYNERENVIRLIPEIFKRDDRLHVLVVDDGSPDDTAGEVLRLRAESWAQRLWLKSRSGKLGLGTAYVDGFQWGLSRDYDFLIQMDADWSHHPRYLDKMIQCAAQADFVIASRYVSGGGTLNWGAGRGMLSKFGSFYSRLVLGVRISDFTGGFNGWTATVLRKIGLETVKSNGYSFQIELKYRAHKLGFCAHRISFCFRRTKRGPE